MLWKNSSYFDRLGRRIGILFSKFSLSPNQWTGLGLLFILITFYFIINQSFLIATVLFAFTAFIDMIDGAVARVTKRVTKLGGYLDRVIDRIVEFIIIFGLFLINYPDFIISIKIWLLFLLFGSFMSTYTRTAAFEKGILKDVKGGILEHTDRMIFLFLIILISIFSFEYATYLIVITTILANVSTLQRFLKAVKR
jgi:archaetidylinositol phosphate synthase